MSWLGVEGHDAVVERFRRSVTRGRLASTFLFVGPGGIGKRLFATKLAQSLLCETTPDNVLDACGECPACQQTIAMSHPDFDYVCKPEDRTNLPVELLIGDKEHRMREGLCHRISMRPSRGGRRIAIIDDADYLHEEGANCLLKTLEEPPKKSVLILISTSTQRQLPTIRSRCQVVPFRPLSSHLIERLLVEKGLVDDAATAARLAPLAEGSLERAVALNSPEFYEFRQSLFQTLAAGGWEFAKIVELISTYVDAAGKEAQPRRIRLRTAVTCVVDFLRQLIRDIIGATPHSGVEMQSATRQLAGIWPQDPEAVGDMIQRSFDALRHIDANGHIPTVLEAWIDGIVERYYGTSA